MQIYLQSASSCIAREKSSLFNLQQSRFLKARKVSVAIRCLFTALAIWRLLQADAALETLLWQWEHPSGMLCCSPARGGSRQLRCCTCLCAPLQWAESHPGFPVQTKPSYKTREWQRGNLLLPWHWWMIIACWTILISSRCIAWNCNPCPEMLSFIENLACPENTHYSTWLINLLKTWL